VEQDVVVVGAGVAGLTSAVCLAEAGLPVRIRAGVPPLRTTSVVAGAIAGGASFADPNEATGSWHEAEEAVRWHEESLDEFTELAARPGTGVRIGHGRMVCAEGDAIPGWARRQPDFRPCSPLERAGYAVGFWMSVPVIDMRQYLEYLTRRLTAAGGTLDLRPVASLGEAAAHARIVVNCAGADAGRLAGDPSVVPVRGQHVVVDNPGLSEFLFEFPGAGHRSPTFTGIVPHADRVVLGGTAERGSTSLAPDPAATDAILRRCVAVEPRLAGAEVRAVEVGLRAARPDIRLTDERVEDVTVIHNYGHGGVAVGMSWGCARRVAQLASAGRVLGRSL
jgi:D-amino-acid oxidase